MKAKKEPRIVRLIDPDPKGEKRPKGSTFAQLVREGYISFTTEANGYWGPEIRMGTQLPGGTVKGFYWDIEKKDYFLILIPNNGKDDIKQQVPAPLIMIDFNLFMSQATTRKLKPFSPVKPIKK